MGESEQAGYIIRYKEGDGTYPLIEFNPEINDISEYLTVSARKAVKAVIEYLKP